MQKRSPIVLLVCGAVVLAACRRLPPSKPDSELTPQEVAGQQVFRANCGACHYPNTTRPLHGPGLQAILKEPWLPSGAPADDDHIRSVVLHGRNNMPAIRTIDDDQMTALLAYLHTI